MITGRFSMRTTMALIVLTMGILGMSLAVYTGYLYRNLTLSNQSNAFSSLIKQQLEEHLDHIQETGGQLALSIQADKGFRAAFQTGDPEQIAAQLGEHFQRFFVTTQALDVKRLQAYDRQFRPVAASTGGQTDFQPGDNFCPPLTRAVTARTGAQRMKPLWKLCSANDRPYLVGVMPIGGLRLQGYIEVIIDPLSELQHAEKNLAFPLTLRYPNSRIAYQSERWPKGQSLKKRLVSHYILKDASSQPALQASIAYDVSDLHEQLGLTRNLLLLHASVTTLIAIALSLLLLEKTAIRPITKLTQQLRLLHQDKNYLGEPIPVEGDKEIRALSNGFNDMTSELKSLYETLEKMAFTDSLTELPNRTLFFDRLNQSVLINRRQSAPFAVFVMDIDRFKLINDILGHVVGDIILQETSKRLRATVRESDTLSRLGGDEFGALLPKITNIDEANIVISRMAGALNSPITVRGHNLKVSVSIGVVLFPYHGDDSIELLQRAEVAMYHAKSNQESHCFYSAEIDPHSIHELTLESELKEAIEKDQLQLHYQPKIDLQNNHVYGVEALVRWNHPERGFIAPDSFIPLAEQTGLIHPLTQRVLSRALHQCAKWHRQGMFLNVAVNLSPQSLRDTNLIRMVEDELQQAGIGAEYLTLEITESAVMSDPKQALAILERLDEMGVRMSVDDFGTGYSSLAYLKQLPVDELKIDRSFVMQMDTDKNDEVIVHSTIDLAHNMELKVVAEGIENENAWNMLVDLGCDLAQGFFMCRPLDANAFEEWLAEAEWKPYQKDAASS